VVKLTDYTAKRVRTLCASPEDLRARWVDADPFDLLCHLAFNAPPSTRRQRTDRVRQQGTAFFAYFTPEARDILTDLLEKCAADGELQFTLLDVLKLPPISDRGDVNEIVSKFGGTEKLRKAVNQLHALLYEL
jgi:type I restriction enzyme R subunit